MKDYGHPDLSFPQTNQDIEESYKEIKQNYDLQQQLKMQVVGAIHWMLKNKIVTMDELVQELYRLSESPKTK